MEEQVKRGNFYVTVINAAGEEKNVGYCKTMVEADELANKLFKDLQQTEIISIYYEIDEWHRKRGERDHLIDCRVKQ